MILLDGVGWTGIPRLSKVTGDSKVDVVCWIVNRFLKLIIPEQKLARMEALSSIAYYTEAKVDKIIFRKRKVYDHVCTRSVNTQSFEASNVAFDLITLGTLGTRN